MKYTVTWAPTAERALAEIWLRASDRTAVTEASNRIDQALKHDPETKGESRGRNDRILLESPLGVDFEVNALDLKVTVLTVWTY